MLGRYNMPIAAGGQVTSAQDLPDGELIVGVFIDPNMTSTSITFNGAPQAGGSGPYCAISDGLGGAYTKTFSGPGVYVPLDPATFAGLPSITISTGSVEGSARNLILITTKG